MHPNARRQVTMALLFMSAGVAACQPSFTPSASPRPVPSGEAVVLAAGDIAGCDSTGDEATADLLDDLLVDAAGTVLALGDLAYGSGTAQEFADCYDPTWGRHRLRTIATPGNHEYQTEGAAPYFAYLGGIAGEPEGSWRAIEFEDWQLVVLDSNCDEVGGCGPGSPQGRWLAESLPVVSRPDSCTLAMWHHPRWSSGAEHGSDPRTDAIWRLLANAGVDLVLSGHDHQYERFAPMNAEGEADEDGMVQFVVGTGGRPLYAFGEILPTSAAHDNSAHGVLRLTLRPGGYDWEFVPVASADTDFTDAGSADCR